MLRECGPKLIGAELFFDEQRNTGQAEIMMTKPPDAMVDVNPLLVLEELDLKLKNVRDQLRAIPAHREQIQSEIARMDRSLKEKEQAIASKEKNISSAELDLKTSQSQEGEKKLKLNTVKTQKEYDAIKSEIDNAVLERGKLEETILLLMDEISELKNFLKKEKAGGDAKKKEFNEQIAALNASEQKLQAECKAMEDQSQAQAKELPQDAQREYKKLRSIFPEGKILSQLVSQEDNTYICSACNSPVSHQVVIDLKRASRLYHCEYCRRLLFP